MSEDWDEEYHRSTDYSRSVPQRARKTKEDPFKGRRGARGPKKFEYTYEDISELSGLTLAAVRRRASRNQFDPASLGDVFRFINEVRSTK